MEWSESALYSVMYSSNNIVQSSLVLAKLAETLSYYVCPIMFVYSVLLLHCSAWRNTLCVRVLFVLQTHISQCTIVETSFADAIINYTNDYNCGKHIFINI